MRKFLFLALFIVIFLTGAACAETIYIPEEIVLPEAVEDVNPAYLTTTGDSTDMLQINLKNFRIYTFYDKPVGKLTRNGAIRLEGTEGDSSFAVQYRLLDGKMMSFSASKSFIDDDKSVAITDWYYPIGSFQSQRIVRTKEEDRIYIFSTYPTIWGKISGGPQGESISANTWICYHERDRQIVSVEEDPEFDYRDKLLNMNAFVVSGTLNPAQLSSVDGELVYIPASASTAGAITTPEGNSSGEDRNTPALGDNHIDGEEIDVSLESLITAIDEKIKHDEKQDE